MPRTQQTLLFPSLVNGIAAEKRLSVLEIGVALPETMHFFSQFKCRLHFAAMYSDPLLTRQSEDLSEEELVALISSSLDFPKNTSFDLCLFWDFFNYLNDRTLRAFNTAFKPFIHETTRAHAFAVRTLETSFSNQQYGIEQGHIFKVRPRLDRPVCYPHTQAILLNLLPSFDIDQGMLLPDGRLEVLMTASNERDTSGNSRLQTLFGAP